MNRLLPLFLVLCLLACLLTGCVGQAAPLPEEDASKADPVVPSGGAVQPDQQEPPPQIPETKPEPEPEEPYVRTIDPAGPMVALTFDDGPHPVYSHQILDILEENHGVATFFEVGRSIAQCPDALPRMLELGCEVGSHSNSHRDLGKLGKSAILQDLQAADEAFLSATGTAPTLLRPPYGSVNKAVKYATNRSVVTWTVDTQDWLSRDADKVVEYVQGLASLDGEIVLLHSTYESTVEAVRTLVPWLVEQGYQLVTVSELMAYYYGELLQPNQFYGYTYFTTHSRTDTPLTLPAPGESIPQEEAAVPEEDPAKQEAPENSESAPDTQENTPGTQESTPGTQESAPAVPPPTPTAPETGAAPPDNPASEDSPAGAVPEGSGPAEEPSLPPDQPPADQPPAGTVLPGELPGEVSDAPPPPGDGPSADT